MKTLEILIPTYGRPESAAGCIESCLANPDPRLAVRCNSNGYEPSLEKFRGFDERLNYDCFATNRGVHANFQYLLQTTTARFCMLLSDEDRVDSSGMMEFLNFLDKCPESIGVVSCSIFDQQNNRYYSRPNRLSQVDLNLDAVSALPIIPSYMSGIVFSVTELAKLDLNALLTYSLGNSYMHLDIARYLLVNRYLRIYKPYFVLKGEEIHEGGDAYSHRKSRVSRVAGNLDLNPLIHGPNARSRQFYYLENHISKVRQHMGLVAYFLTKLNLFIFLAGAVFESGSIVVTSQSASINSEVRLALREAKLANEFSGSMFSYLFYPFAQKPTRLKSTLLNFLAKTMSLFNKVLVPVVFFRSRRI
jgi:hypothetical protein